MKNRAYLEELPLEGASRATERAEKTVQKFTMLGLIRRSLRP